MYIVLISVDNNEYKRRAAVYDVVALVRPLLELDDRA